MLKEVAVAYFDEHLFALRNGREVARYCVQVAGVWVRIEHGTSLAARP